MEEITFQEFLIKSGQMLEKYRSNIDHLKIIRDGIEKIFFSPEEMVAYFYANKSEYFTWQKTQDSIITLEEAYNELVENMMDARGEPEIFKYHLRDNRIPVLVYPENNEVDIEDDEEGEELILEEISEENENEMEEELEKETKEE
ncbi:MAG: hypothetical protein KAS63_09515 [Candidatus Heimdallarchaeota archaeon]|nr:hypothetical protein [Candidatus Heimdallarchaeota archaeon]MCK4955587.1 hypothetical protein [Candidatus Heimdallarchaeota archaeon]